MQGWVKCELIQTLNFGENWTRLAPKHQFIPLGPPGAFDSHTLYTAWSGEQSPVINPANPNETMFYYAGGNGPHSGQRDDSIGLARSTTNAYTGMRRRDVGGTTARLTTEPLDWPSGTSLEILADSGGSIGHVQMWLADAKGQPRTQQLDVRSQQKRLDTSSPVWISVSDEHFAGRTAVATRIAFEASPNVTLYALRLSTPQRQMPQKHDDASEAPPSPRYNRTVRAWRGSTPTIDGMITTEEWSDGFEISTPFKNSRGGQKQMEWTSYFRPVEDPADLSMHGWVKHDDRALYLGFEVSDNLLHGIESPVSAPCSLTTDSSITPSVCLLLISLPVFQSACQPAR
eukprot:SAG31_NODE_629_length_13436_cov_116.287825_2_plen_344_part_00